MGFNLDNYLTSCQKIINRLLNDLIESHAESNRVARAMLYSLSAGGKRVRPILVIAAAEAMDADKQIVLPTACAIEMIHTYSLIHDDLPAMDNDDLRRGKPTSHIKFDEATAILAGDALLTYAFEVLASQHDDTRSSLNRCIKILQVLSRASGFMGMIQGQMQDIQSEGRVLDLDGLKQLHRRKTGALIEASVVAGSLFGETDQSQRMNQLGTYARHIGLAFQVVDDILNVTGDPRKLGKAIGTDNDRGKNTFPGLMGVEKATQYAENLISKSLYALTDFDSQADPLRAIARYIIERNR